MKTIATLIIVVLVSSCTSFSQKKTEIRNVTGYTEIDVNEGIKVELTLGIKEFVEVTADEDIIDRVITEISGNELNIYLKGNSWRDNRKTVLVKVTATKIESIDASSGADIISQNLIKSDKLEMSVSSGASIQIAFKTLEASCNASSGADAKLKGASKYFEVEASSGANINADKVVAMKVEADVSSGADITVHAEEEIDAEASSGGSIKYSGSPKIVDIEKSSGGSVRKL